MASKKFASYGNNSALEISVNTWYNDGRPNGLRIRASRAGQTAEVCNAYGEQFTLAVTGLLDGDLRAAQMITDCMGGTVKIIRDYSLCIKVEQDRGDIVEVAVTDSVQLVEYLEQCGFATNKAKKAVLKRCSFPKCLKDFDTNPDARVILLKNGEEKKFCEAHAVRLITDGFSLQSSRQIAAAKAAAEAEAEAQKQDNEEKEFIRRLKG